MFVQVKKSATGLYILYGDYPENNLSCTDFETCVGEENGNCTLRFSLDRNLGPHKPTDYDARRLLAKIDQISLIQIGNKTIVDHVNQLLSRIDHWNLEVSMNGTHRFAVKPDIHGDQLIFKIA
jgi:hypothetical protein